VGGREVIEADVRVIAATNRDPVKAIADHKLREDLYYRLNVFTITIPPLRDRPEDIPPLARHFAEQYASRAGTPVPAIDQGALQKLLSHRWAGNVRELKNAIERAALVSGGTTILPEHLPPEVARETAPRAVGAPAGEPSDRPFVMLPVGVSMEEAEREMIRSTLQHASGNKTRAARILGISLKTMHNKVKKFGL
jgi:DNA-binding NtrC family response regulator